MTKNRFRPGSLCVGLLLLTGSVAAREIHVTPRDDGSPVLGPALASADPGDSLHIAKGLYRETIRIPKEVTLVGEPGATLDPSRPLAVEWKPATDVGAGVFRAAAGRRPHALFLDGKVLAALDEVRTKEGKWAWRKLLAAGPPLGGFEFIRALWIYQSDEKALYLRVAEGADPAGLNLSVVWSEDPVIAIAGATNVSIRGLTLAHGYAGIVIDGNASRCTVSRCTVGPWEDAGITVKDGSSHCLIESNEIFRGSLEDWTPVDEDKARYEIWQIHKDAGFYDRIGINLFRAGAGNRVHANRIVGTFDGIALGDYAIESLDKELTRPDDGRDTEIWENVIERTRDSGIELGGGCINVRVHHNVLRRTHGGLRFKLPRIGPVFVYRNVLVDGTPYSIWYSMDDSPAEGYVYHNTIMADMAGLVYGGIKKPHHIGAPRWHYLNNLVITKQGFFKDGSRGALPVNFIADYNIGVGGGGGRPWRDDPARDLHSQYLNRIAMQPGFPPAPEPGSPAIDAGLDLSTSFHGKPLPGCEPGCFKGKAPDVGAVEVQ